MNYMKDVAQLLGVKLGEEFKIYAIGGYFVSVYKFDENGLKVMSPGGEWWPDEHSFCNLLIGINEAVHLQDYYKQLVSRYGLKFGEEFVVSNFSKTFRCKFTEKGLLFYNGDAWQLDNNNWDGECILMGIEAGIMKVIGGGNR